MAEYDIPKEPLRDDRAGLNPMGLINAFAGLVLIAIGVVVGLNTVSSVFNLIRGKDPPALVDQLAKPMAEKVVDEVKGQAAVQVFDLSPDLKRAILWFLTFLFLLIPVTIATCLIANGAKLMHGDTAEALRRIAEQFKKPRD